MVTRRFFVMGGATGLAAVLASSRWSQAPQAAETFEVTHSDAEWRKLLTPDQYAVLRQSATERPFTSALLHEERRGNFACAGCDLDLFSSAMKFESGTGWPSFWAPLDKAVGTSQRHFLRHDPDSRSLQPLWRPSGSCLQRRSEANGPAILYERRSVEL
jgi:peptide-methionine (R)-S-oxide reductase